MHLNLAGVYISTPSPPFLSLHPHPPPRSGKGRPVTPPPTQKRPHGGGDAGDVGHPGDVGHQVKQPPVIASSASSTLIDLLAAIS